MKTILFLLTFNLCIFSISFSQSAPAIEWQNTIGGGNNDDVNDIKKTTDGGYILAGSSASNISGDKTENCIGADDYWIVKIDSVGNIQWQNTIGGDVDDVLYAVQQTSDGGYILGGHSYSDISGDKTENNNGSVDMWIVKTDAAGNIQWQNTIGGTGIDFLNSMQQTQDGGFILGSRSKSNISVDKTENCIGGFDYWIIKTDTVGNIEWQNTIGGNGDDFLFSVQQTTDEGFIIGGYSISNISGDKTENSIGDFDYWIVKTDKFGNIQWQNTIGGNLNDACYSATQTIDGGYILGGYSLSGISGDKTEASLGDRDYWLVKTDSLGNVLWQNTIGGSSTDVLYIVRQSTDGGYFLGGDSRSNISGDKTENNWDLTQLNPDYWIVKTDSVGNIVWDNTIGGVARDYFSFINESGDGGIVLGGISESNISGDKTENCIGGWDYWIIKLFSDTITSAFNLQNTTTNIQLFPNPAKEEVTINIIHPDFIGQPIATSVFDVMGNVVLRKEQSKTSNIKLQTSNFSKGIYLVEVKSNNNVYRSKLIKE